MSIATIWANDPSGHRILLLRRRYRRWSRLLERRKLPNSLPENFSQKKIWDIFWRPGLRKESCIQSHCSFRTLKLLQLKTGDTNSVLCTLRKHFLQHLERPLERLRKLTTANLWRKQTNLPPCPAFCADSSITEGLGGTSDTRSQFRQKTEGQSGLNGLLSRFSSKGCSLTCWVRWSPCFAPEGGWSSSVVAASKCCCSLICSWSCFTSCWSSASCRVVFFHRFQESNKNYHKIHGKLKANGFFNFFLKKNWASNGTICSKHPFKTSLKNCPSWRSISWIPGTESKASNASTGASTGAASSPVATSIPSFASFGAGR